VARIEVRTWINAPSEVCFDLARSQSAHVSSARQTSERIVAGPPNDLLELGDVLTFEARHFGVRQRLTAEIVAFDRPRMFVDEARHSAFRSMRHEHRFTPVKGGTEMQDTLECIGPLGLIGRLAEVVFLSAYMRRFIIRRAHALKGMAESSSGTGGKNHPPATKLGADS
jgi:ligand-binding SRPBCC domain-containing protein